MFFNNWILDVMFFVSCILCIFSHEAYQHCSCERVSRALAKELVGQFNDGKGVFRWVQVKPTVLVMVPRDTWP